MKRAALCALLFLLPLNALAAQKEQPPFSVAIRFDRTALWVGDSLEYTIQVIHPRSVQFVRDHLQKENLSLPPFVVRAAHAAERDWRDDMKLFEVVLLLTTYETGKPEVVVPPLALYFFRRDGTASEKDDRAHSIRIPPQRIPLRSTLPPGQPRLREFKPIEPVEPVRAIGALLLGLVGLGYLGAYGAVQLWRAVHREKSVKRPAGRRARGQWTQAGLRRIREMAQNPAQNQEVFCGEVTNFLRQYVTEWLNVEARGLTPIEADEALRAAGYNGAFAHQVRAILEQCEQAQYGKVDRRPAGDERQRAALLGSLEEAIKISPRAR